MIVNGMINGKVNAVRSIDADRFDGDEGDLSACEAPEISVDNDWMPGKNGSLTAMGKVNGIVNRIVNAVRSIDADRFDGVVEDLSACEAPDNVSVDNNWMPGKNGRLIAMGKVNGIVNRKVNAVRSIDADRLEKMKI